MQEGRGIGLINKLRAYNIQKLGLDTYESNQVLGFNDDDRDFKISALILKDLEINDINLLTSNKTKVKQLDAFGINVVRTTDVYVANQHNEDYLRVKLSRNGVSATGV